MIIKEFVVFWLTVTIRKMRNNLNALMPFFKAFKFFLMTFHKQI